MQLSAVLSRSRLCLKLNWRPREENTVADDITNSVLDQVDVDKQVLMVYEDLPLDIIDKLWKTKADFESQKALAKEALVNNAGVMKRRKTEKSAW